jgi:steroid delta-isomerase-like uncharacterized protein
MRNRMVGSSVIAFVLVACGGAQQPAGPAASASASAAVSASASVAPLASSAPPVVVAPPPPPVPLRDAITKLIAANIMGFKGHDSKTISELYGRDAVIVSPGPNGMEETNPNAMTRDLDALFAAFPDAQFSAIRVLGRDHIAVLEWVISGTNKGDFMGHAASNKAIGYHGISILMFADNGQVKHETMYFDMGTVMGQLGLGPKGQKARPTASASLAAPEITLIEDGAAPGADNVSALKTFYLANDHHDDKTIGALLTDNAVMSTAYMAQDQKRPDILKSAKENAKAFPDSKTDAIACWNVGDWAVCETQWSATWKGPSMGMKPTNKSGSVHSVDLVKFNLGKVDWVESFANSSEFAASFGVPVEKPKSQSDQVTLTGPKPPKAPPAPKK